MNKEKTNFESTEMTAVKLDFIIKMYERCTSLDSESMSLLHQIFDLLEQIEANDTDDRKYLWLKVARGSIDDYGFEDENEGFEYFCVDNTSELYEAFEKEYPEPYYWYKLTTVKYRDYRYLGIENFAISVSTESNEDVNEFYRWNCKDLFLWLIDAIKDVINKCEMGVYNEYVSTELPYSKRYGVISRKELWDHRPYYRENNLKDLSKEEIEHFIDVISYEEKQPSGRVDNMTFNKYFELAIRCFKNAGLEVREGDSLLRQFERHGEDFGVCNFKGIDLDSTDDFYRFIKEKPSMGGHPWGLRRGSSRTRIMLYPVLDGNGCFFVYRGDPNWNVYEMIKMYLALKESGIPVAFLNSEEIIRYLREEDKVGFVPDDQMPIYQHSAFKEPIQDFYYFDPLKDKAIKDKIEWYTEKPVILKIHNCI